eukprot:scaffold13311_cov161-Cylindrotheca_fusiformis.AAC.9
MGTEMIQLNYSIQIRKSPTIIRLRSGAEVQYQYCCSHCLRISDFRCYYSSDCSLSVTGGQLGRELGLGQPNGVIYGANFFEFLLMICTWESSGRKVWDWFEVWRELFEFFTWESTWKKDAIKTNGGT